MPAEIVEYKSSIAFYIAIFAVAIVWVFVGAEQAHNKIISIFVDPFDWLLISSAIVVTMILPVTLISYNWKHQVIFSEPTWEYRTREVEIFEFEKVMKEYERAYSFLMSHTDYFMFILIVITCLTSIFFPFVFPLSIPLLIWGPYVYAGLILISIFLLSLFVFKATPNSATSYFQKLPTKSLRKLVTKMWDTRGISWAGIRLNIGEAEGYYIIQEVKPVGRIEGIESVGSIEIVCDDKGLYRAFSILHLGPVDGSKTITLDSGFTALEALDLNTLVKRTIIAYTESKGINEILEEVMIDLGISLGEDETDVLMSDCSDSSDESGVVDNQ